MSTVGLLIVDLQTGFKPEKNLVDRIAAEAKCYKNVVMTRFSNLSQSLYRSVLNWHGDGGELALKLPNALVLHKVGYGLTDLHIMQMRMLGCLEWVICGLETDACVMACAFSLWDAGLVPVIRTDLCDSPLQKEGVAVIERQFGSFRN